MVWLLRALARQVLDCINSWEPVSHFDYPYGESIFLMCCLLFFYHAPLGSLAAAAAWRGGGGD